MSHPIIVDTRIAKTRDLINPQALLADLPVEEEIAQHITKARKAIENILDGADDRLLVVVGPCSIHDPKAALEYGQRLAAVAEQFSRQLFIVMRVYFEKPRTTVGWKGLINDPHLDESYNIDEGLHRARQLLLDLNAIKMPCATEFLDIISPQYVSDLVSWGAIGARTTESQIHRELASGLSCPIGFKNGTDGNVKVAADAIRSAQQKHHFLSVTQAGCLAVFETRGNKACHIILRGGKNHPNYQAAHIDSAVQVLSQSGLPGRLMVDCSHANSNKDYRRQASVAKDVAEQVAAGDLRIMGVMLESNLVAGSQEIVPGEALIYGQSITDSCMSWEQTEDVLAFLSAAISHRRRHLSSQE